jgi:segregation and condensation protein B
MTAARGDQHHTTDDTEQTADSSPETAVPDETPQVTAEENKAAAGSDPAAEAATELDVSDVDPLVQEALASVVEDVGALVETTFEAEADEAAAAVEAELQREDLESGETEATPLAVPDAGMPMTSEAETEPGVAQERPDESDAADGALTKRARRSREASPAVAGDPGGAPAPGPVATSSPLPDSSSLGLTALVESLLFVADGAVPVSRLAEALEIHPREVERALADLQATYQQRGLSVQRFRDRVQLTTAPAAAPLVERFLGLAASSPLSRAALEALAIIAYQQPVTRPQIEAVRGVNSDSVIKNLLTKGLIEESGRAEGPGRPVLYSTTTEFMQHFGLNALTDLPPLTPAGPEPGETISELLKG